MPSSTIKIKSSEGGEFDCYLSLPGATPAPAIVLMASVASVTDDLRKIADELADQGMIVAAPELFWRSDPGVMPKTDDGRQRTGARSRPRVRVIERGVPDLADTMAVLKSRPDCNGKIAVAGYCYGGPYGFIGPGRLGCDAGFSFHGTKMDYWLDELAGITAPVAVFVGDEDHAAPPHVLAQIEAGAEEMANLELHVYPGVKHGYTSASSDAHDADAYQASSQRMFEILAGLKDGAQVAAE